MANPDISLARRSRDTTVIALLNSLEDAHDGPTGLAETLAESTDPRALKLAAMLQDPQWRGKSLAEIAYDADLAPSTIVLLLRDGAVARAIAHAQVRLQARLPKVVDTIASAAEGGLVLCGCTVGGQIEPLPTCPTCRGLGKKPTPGSLPHQELILEVLGLTSKGGGVAVNVQQNVAISQAGSVFDAFVKSTPIAPSRVFDVPTAIVE